jgi:hypothetical protein
LFGHDAYMKILNEGTEPLRPDQALTPQACYLSEYVGIMSLGSAPVLPAFPGRVIAKTPRTSQVDALYRFCTGSSGKRCARRLPDPGITKTSQ